MEYLNHVLGIRIVYKGDVRKSLPNFICTRYQVQEVTLDGKNAVFVYPKKELEAINAIKKHMVRIERTGTVDPYR